MKFKVGDRVQLTKQAVTIYTAWAGPATVISCYNDNWVEIRPDHRQDTGAFSEDSLDFLENSTPLVAEGIKHDRSKIDLSLNPLAALNEMAKAFMHGEKKYGRNNYKKGMESHRYIAACLRHVTAWQNGESLDPESGNHHLGHALASLAMLLECERVGTLKDTRNANT